MRARISQSLKQSEIQIPSLWIDCKGGHTANPNQESGVSGLDFAETSNVIIKTEWFYQFVKQIRIGNLKGFVANKVPNIIVSSLIQRIEAKACARHHLRVVVYRFAVPVHRPQKEDPKRGIRPEKHF